MVVTEHIIDDPHSLDDPIPVPVPVPAPEASAESPQHAVDGIDIGDNTFHSSEATIESINSVGGVGGDDTGNNTHKYKDIGIYSVGTHIDCDISTSLNVLKTIDTNQLIDQLCSTVGHYRVLCEDKK